MVHVADPRGRWAVSASEVLRILPAVEWRGGAPIDVLGALGPLGGRARRVLVLRGVGNREIALVAAGGISVGDVDPHDVLPLPSVLAAASPQVSAIIASEASLSLLIEPSAVISSSDPVVGEELCPSHS